MVVNINSLSLAPHLSALTGSETLTCERYRTLAVRVSSSLARRKLKTLLVTSAEQGEGKSAVAASLAWMMAKRDNRRVLLIDAGLRSAPSSIALNVAPPRGWLGMTDVSSAMTDALVRLDPNRLYVMTPTGAHQKAELDDAAIDDALASSQFEKLVAELTGYFDFIVIDGPAICRSYGAQQFASIADGTILVARAGQTHRSRVMTAVDLVPQERRVGIVLNESEVEAGVGNRNGADASLIKRLFGFARARTKK
ncbi:MAG TPA: cellulose synthase operon protein YhjQ/BcsQ [Blastocatellia bacterium]|nr:cellulose synthase operon protein YhjQ/BcsQ [Blastocatellia bacterium]